MMFLLTKIINIVKRAVISNSLTDDKETSLAQITYLEKTGLTEVVTPYGSFARPPVDTQLLLFAVQSQENNRAGIAYSQENRFKNLEEGECGVGNPLTRSFIKFDKEGNILITATAKVIINSTEDIDITTSGKVDLKSTGDVDIDAPQVNLGIGGLPIARLGDEVLVEGVLGTITSAGNNTST